MKVFSTCACYRLTGSLEYACVLHLNRKNIVWSSNYSSVLIRTLGGNVHSCRKLFNMLNADGTRAGERSKRDHTLEELSYADNHQ